MNRESENLEVDYLSRLEGEAKLQILTLINESFLDEQLLVVSTDYSPWYADFMNYLVSKVMPF